MKGILRGFAPIALSLFALNAGAAVLYVDIGSASPTPPYTNWTTAAANIQDAVDAASNGDQILVTNGVYQTGGQVVPGNTLSNRVAVTKAVSVESVNGPDVTAIQGYQVPGTTNDNGAVRCVYLADGAVLSGFTLTNGATLQSVLPDGFGGGVYCVSTNAVVTNCVVVGNSAYSWGGGVFQGTLNNCALNGNTAFDSGGGAWQSILINCVLSGNQALHVNGGGGGGAYYCTLDGCMLSNNVAVSGGGGAFSSSLYNCTLAGNSAGSGGGGACFSTLSNCTLTANSAYGGGGVQACTLDRCLLSGNTASFGGGGAVAYNSTVINSTLSGNSALSPGGAAYSASLSNCTLSGNSAASGGGADSCGLTNCTLMANTALDGGAANNCQMQNCALAGNSAGDSGGGAEDSSLANCTLTGNSAFAGGGADNSTLNNCIVYYNNAPSAANYSDSCTLNYCCTTPLPATGTTNLAASPQLAGIFHLSTGSPCRGAGSPAFATGVDIDGEAWANPPSIGCDEYNAGAFTGPLSVAIQAAGTNAAPGFDLDFIASITGPAYASRWEFGDGTIVSNQPYASHHWLAAGDYAVVLRAYNDTYPVGVSAAVTVHVVTSPVQYVSLDSANPVPPFTSWATAATNIQDAVDAAFAGGTILVSNGVYQSDSRVVYGATNRLAINRPLTVQSLNGPAATSLDGASVMRCVFLADGASLAGFTLSNGTTPADGGGLWCESTNAAVSNCVFSGNSAGGMGGAAFGGTLTNCVLSGNSAGGNGGGADASVLQACNVSSNTAAGTGGGADSCWLSFCNLSTNSSGDSGGGANASALNDCTLASNWADNSGGGSEGGTLVRCQLTGNATANNGGGAENATLSNCLLTGNQAAGAGGGVNACALSACALTLNVAAGAGGGAEGGTLTNCTLTGNSAAAGGGADSSTLYNCILYYNHAPRLENYSGSAFLTNCCTTPLPSNGANNITAEPQLATASHLSAGSPCLGAGSAAFTTGLDIDGEAWASPPAIGCDELHVGVVTGLLSVAIQAAYTNVAVGFAVDFAALVSGPADASLWDFGDGTLVTNEPYTSHGWAVAGDYAVVLRVYNDSFPTGVTGSITVHVAAQPVHFVSLASTNPVAPYSSWETAATNIQDAVDAALVPGAMVEVTNGIYQIGGQVIYGAMTNRLAVTKPVVVVSVSGPAFTVIQGSPTNGDAAIRCAYLTNGAVLSGFTLTLGATRSDGDNDQEQSGGAVWCESSQVVVSNCVITGNAASFGGGGVIGGTLFNCTLSTNFAGGEGGGADYSVLTGCTLSGNYGPDWWGNGGGGACYSTLTNSTLSGNEAYYGGAAAYSDLSGCSLIGNSSPDTGGGVNLCTLTLCTVSRNSAYYSGGGAESSTLDRSVLSGNTAFYGAGADNCILRSSSLSGNLGNSTGGGANASSLNNCTLTGNSAATAGGGVTDCTLNNCIVYYNSAPNDANYSGSTLNYCCTVPLPATGTSNITAEPQLAGLSHISSSSPCIGAGSALYATGTDIDGEAWANPPSIGCDEYQAGAATGSLSVAISASFTNTTPGVALDFIAQISGRVSASQWEFGDGTVVSNQPYASHSWSALGDYPVALRAFNDTYPAGISATVTVHVVTQPVYYVALESTNPVAPFASWATAATNIQDAVDAVTSAGALVLVSNGVYGVGARLVNNDVPHRLVVVEPITVSSVNGPGATAIEGNGWDDPVRCAYVGAGGVLSGFTLTNGAAMPPWLENVEEDLTAGGVWCESASAQVSNCVIVACSVGATGGGAYGGTFNDCTFLNNSASYGGAGANFAVLNHCTLLTNSASWYGEGAGAGAANSTLADCLLAGNMGDVGGAASSSTLENCTLMGNSASSGGGADSSTLINCALAGNAASNVGGGASSSTLYNCTLTGNSATNSGGGVSGCTNFNCIVYYNLAPSGSNWSASTLSYSCTLPLPPGPGNLGEAPLLADFLHLSAGSPCRGAGLAAYATGTDIDGEPWLNPPSVGCDEYYTGAITGPLTVAIQTPYTNVAAGHLLSLQATISGHAAASQWDFGDGTVVSNQPYVLHSWAVPADYPVVLQAFNDSFPAGVSTTIIVHVQSPIHYVAQDNAAPLAPYSTWATAATNIQDAVDATFVGGTVIVSNGLYQFGGSVASSLLTNRVAVTRQMNLLSVNGPAVTIIQGNSNTGPSAVRCVSLVRDSLLAGFTLTGGATRNDGDGDLDQTGGGVWCDSLAVLVSNCVITGNSAVGGGGGSQRGTLSYCTLSTNSSAGAVNGLLDHCSVLGNSGSGAGGSTLTSCLIEGNSAYDAGGLSWCTLTNCTIRGNQATRYGGGSWASTMYNCLVISNTAGSGGGGLYNDWAYNCTIVGNSTPGYGGGMLIASFLANCILYYNSAPNGPNYWSDYLFNCCSLPAYPGNSGNLSNAPAFVNLAGGDFHLQPNSPCINSGNNAYAAAGPDLDGNPRIVAGTVDVGAYEFQAPQSFTAWLQQYGLPTDGSADYADSDNDGMNNWQEWIAGTNPTNALSVLRLLSVTPNGSGLTVTWQSVSNRTYFLERSSNLGAQPAFLTLATNIPGQSGTTSYTDTNALGAGPFFYRVGVQTSSNQLQTSLSIISFAWLQQYGLPTDGSADFTDSDGDGMNNWQEWIAGTNPLDASSVLKILSLSNDVSGLTITWQSVSNVPYYVQRSTNLSAQPPFASIVSNIVGQTGTISFTDTNAAGNGPFFYRVGVQ